MQRAGGHLADAATASTGVRRADRAYANVSYGGAGGGKGDDPDLQLRGSDIGDNTPARYARFAQEWLDMGAQIVGGCCAATPGHIAALDPVVKVA